MDVNQPPTETNWDGVIKFTTGHDQLVTGKKTQTVRKGYAKWARRLAQSPLVDICWINPDGTTTKLAQGTATVAPQHGYEFDSFTVIRDGYCVLEELHNRLADIYDMIGREVFIYRWAVINWVIDETFIYDGNRDSNV